MTQRGFTLLELMLAVLIMSMIGTLTWGAMSTTFNTQRSISERTVLQEIGTSVLAKIREDLSQTFIVEAPSQISYFTGLSSTEQDKMSFTTMSHIRSGPNTHESDQTEITYDTEANPTGDKLYRLRRKENRYLSTEKNDSGDVVVLTDRVVSFKTLFNNGQEDQSKWDSKSVEEKNKLPKTVRVSLLLRDEKGREESYEAVVELPMAESLSVDRGLPATPNNNTLQQGGVPGQGGTPTPGVPGTGGRNIPPRGGIGR